MTIKNNSVATQNLLYNTIYAEQQKTSEFANSANPQTAQRVGEIHSSYPALPPGVKLSLAKAGFTNEQIEKIYPSVTEVVQQQSTEPPRKKSFWERNIFDKIKTGTRWGFAGLNFPLDFVQGGLAQIFDKDDSIDGWFISTDLGTMIKDHKKAGNGWFMGDDVRALQAERARRYRGTVGGHAWTIGRGLSSVVFEPDSIPYNVMSGALDAATALWVPTPGKVVGETVGKSAHAFEEAGGVSKFISGLNRTQEFFGHGSTTIQATKAHVDDVKKWADEVLVGNQVDYKAANKWFGTTQAKRVLRRAAETKDPFEIWDLFGRKIEPDLALDLAKSTDPNEIRQIISSKLGQSAGLYDTRQITGGGLVHFSTVNRDKWISKIPSGKYISRAFEMMPKKSVNLMQATTPADKIRNIETLDRLLKLSLVDGETHASLMNRAMDLIVNKDFNKIQQFTADTYDAVKASVVNQGVHPEVAKAIIDGGFVSRDIARKFHIDNFSDMNDAGLWQKTVGVVKGVLAGDTVFAGPQLTSELAQNEMFIPDVRQIRRLTGTKFNWLFSKSGKYANPDIAEMAKAGQLRFPFAAMSAVQNEVWRPLVTMTIGNFTRNVLDSQIMIALSHLPVSSLITHPFEYLLMMRGDQKFADLFARDIDADILANAVSDVQINYRRAITEGVGSHFEDPIDPYRRAQRTGTWTVFDRGVDSKTSEGLAAVARAHGDEIGKLNADWAARQIAGGKSVDEIIDMIRARDNDAVDWFKETGIYYRGGRDTFTASAPIGSQWSRDVVDITNPTNLRAILKETEERVVNMTGNHPELQAMIAEGKLAPVTIKPNSVVEGGDKVGSRVLYRTNKKDRLFARGEVIGINASTGELEVRPFAFINGETTRESHNFLKSDDIFYDPSMPRRVATEVRDTKNAKNNLVKESFDKLVDFWHAHLYNEPIGKLERSPIFKELYHEWIDKLATSLDSKSVDDIIADVTARAAAEGLKPERFMKESAWQKLLDIQSGKIKNYGSISREELNAFASGAALDEMKKMFYDAADRSNFVDAFRLISPFAQQQGEFLARMGRNAFRPTAGGKFYLPDTDVLRKTQLAWGSLTQGDPDGNGRGFIFKDPTTGQWSFTVPMSGQLTKLLTGTRSELNVGVKGMFLGFDYRPGLGPFATMAVSAVMPDSPRFDDFRAYFLPYGEKTDFVESLTPSWMRKMYDGATGNEGSSIFMNTYVETMEALVASGQYDTTNLDSRDKLMHDAKSKAQVLTMLRAAGQFIGPAAGNWDQLVKTKNMDAYASQLTKAFQELKENDYDTAVTNFIKIFGDDAFAYMGSKSKSLYGGLEASKEFGKFERGNPRLFDQFKDVAGYFGPIGSNFDFNVYQRQLVSGRRVKLTPEESLEVAEQTIGSAYYRTLRKEYPANPNAEQMAYLREYKKALQKAYPGYAKMVFDVNKLPRTIESLGQAATMSALDGNPAAEAVRKYMAVRQYALQQANARGHNSLGAEDSADLRDYLVSYGNALSSEYPDFARVYDRLLSQEVEK